MSGQGTIQSYLFGFGVSLLLTVGAYLLASAHVLSGLSFELSMALLTILQSAVFLNLYLNLGKELKPRWNMIVFFFMLLVTVLFVSGSIWIMHHLNYNLMMRT